MIFKKYILFMTINDSSRWQSFSVDCLTYSKPGNYLQLMKKSPFCIDYFNIKWRFPDVLSSTAQEIAIDQQLKVFYDSSYICCNVQWLGQIYLISISCPCSQVNYNVCIFTYNKLKWPRMYAHLSSHLGKNCVRTLCSYDIFHKHKH